MRFPDASSSIPDVVQNSCWPVGSIYISVLATNPASLLGFGVWTSFGAGRCIVGVDTGDSDFDAAEKASGAKTVTLTGAQSGVAAHSHGVTDPGHAHVQRYFPTATGGSTGCTVDTSMSGTQTNSGASTASATTGVTINNASEANAAQAHNNVQPSIAVYLWKRTA